MCVFVCNGYVRKNSQVFSKFMHQFFRPHLSLLIVELFATQRRDVKTATLTTLNCETTSHVDYTKNFSMKSEVEVVELLLLNYWTKLRVIKVSLGYQQELLILVIMLKQHTILYKQV